MKATANIITVEAADEIIETLDIMDQVEDYELNECGHVYTLVDGSAIVITTANDFAVA